MLCLLLAGILVPSAFAQSGSGTGKQVSVAEFRSLMRRLEQAWNANDARTAADCFTEDAIYTSPPDPRVLRGREALFNFFGGPKGRPHAMKMEWHHLLFDEAEQIGAGEYTFTYEIRTHGIVIVRIRNGLISNWREYEKESPADWQTFSGNNIF